MVPRQKFTAYIKALGPVDAPDWQEQGIPDRGDTEERGLLIRVPSLADFPVSPGQEMLDQIIFTARGADAAPIKTDTEKRRFTVIADAHSATMFYSYPTQGDWSVGSYRSVYLTEDVEERLPDAYSVLTDKRVGIVGCGSLGSKMAASLARDTAALESSSDLLGSILKLLDREALFKGLFSHHAVREENLLFPGLDACTTEVEREKALSQSRFA